MLSLDAKIFDTSKYAFYLVKKDFEILTSRGNFEIEKNDTIGLRPATSNKDKIRIIDYDNPNKVYSIDKRDLMPLQKFLSYDESSKQGDIFER